MNWDSTWWRIWIQWLHGTSSTSTTRWMGNATTRKVPRVFLLKPSLDKTSTKMIVRRMKRRIGLGSNVISNRLSFNQSWFVASVMADHRLMMSTLAALMTYVTMRSWWRRIRGRILSVATYKCQTPICYLALQLFRLASHVLISWWIKGLPITSRAETLKKLS